MGYKNAVFSTQKDFSATIRVDSETVTELQIGHDPSTMNPYLRIKYFLLGEPQGELTFQYSDIENIREFGEMVGNACDNWSEIHNAANLREGLINKLCACKTCRDKDIPCRKCKECD